MSADSHSDLASLDRVQRGRTKTFSGCWTCRAKHVKCDEARPVCARCRRLGLSCEGYGIRLSWTPVRSPPNFRGRASSAKRAARRGKANSVSHPRGVAESSGRPFHIRQSPSEGSVEHAESSLRPERTTGSGYDVDSTSDGETLNVLLNSRLSESYKLLGQGLDANVSVPPQQHSARSEVPGKAYAPPDNAVLSEQGTSPMSTDGRDTCYSGIGSFTQGTSTLLLAADSLGDDNDRAGQVDARRKDTIPRHLDILRDPGLHCELMEHWTVHLCDALNPVPGGHNPLRSVMMPIALEGSQTDAARSTGATALFHLICSASASHLSQTRSTQETKQVFENVALEHHNLGITHLGQNIQSNDPSQCVSLLASLVMCILNEAVTMPTEFWRHHFRGAAEWVCNVDPQVWRQTEAASTLYQMFMGMTTLVQSQLLLDSPDNFLWAFSHDSISQVGPYVLNEVFGLPRSLLQSIRVMNAIQIQDRHTPGQHSGRMVNGTPQDLERLEIELYLSTPAKPSTTIRQEYGDLIYHHGYTFYFAALIYMKRTLKETPIQGVQALIEQSLYHMEALEGCTRHSFSPMIWPIAIISFEVSDVELQKRMLRCFDVFTERSGLPIWPQVATLVKNLWELRETEGYANLQWHKSALASMSDRFMML